MKTLARPLNISMLMIVILAGCSNPTATIIPNPQLIGRTRWTTPQLDPSQPSFVFNFEMLDSAYDGAVMEHPQDMGCTISSPNSTFLMPEGYTALCRETQPLMGTKIYAFDFSLNPGKDSLAIMRSLNSNPSGVIFYALRMP